MAISTTGPRSVSDATRFTSTTPHAGSKSSSPSASSSSTSSSSSSAASAQRTASRFARTGSAQPLPNGQPLPRTPHLAGETPEQRVARLRAAHEAAKRAQSSKIDVLISSGRRFFDGAHKVTVMGLIGLTAVAALMTVYTAADMIVYNKKRKAEFIEAQKKMAADSLEAARLAYMTGKATPDQVTLVEEAIEREAGAGSSNIFSKISLLGAPTPIPSSQPAQPEAATSGVTDAAAAAWAESQEQKAQKELRQDSKKPSGIRSWFSSSLGKAEEPEDATKRFGWESLSGEDDGAGVRDSDIVRAVEDKQAYMREKAHAAFEREKERERTGGPLDRVGLEGSNGSTVPKKKWWFW